MNYLVLIIIVCQSKISAEINNGIFMTVGSKPITKSDIKNEVKLLLILRNESFNEEKSKMLYDQAVKSLIKSNIKLIEIEKSDTLQINEQDIDNELKRLANNINIDVDTLKNIFSSNDLDFALVKKQI